MVERLMPRRLAPAALLWACASMAVAQGLPDPTRPSFAVTPAPGASAPAGEAAWVLQSVLLGTGGTPGVRAAVISGQLVSVGERLGDARLLRVTERSAVLHGPQGLTTLWLIADVEKQELPARTSRAPAALGSQAPATPLPARLAESTP